MATGEPVLLDELDGESAARLGATLAQPGTPGTALGSACDTVTQALRHHGEDDITLVLARIRQ